MSHKSLAELLELAKSAALRAGTEVLKIYDLGTYESFSKEDASPVTSADYAANDIIVEMLQNATPDIPIMSEEQKAEDLANRKQWKRYWLIDPIDGTQEFVARSGDFAVNIAMIENGVPVIGVIYWPAGESMYYASKDNGAFKESPTENRQIKVRQFEHTDTDVIVIAISRRQPRENVLSRMNALRKYQTLPLGSCSLKACFIAEGKADLFLRLGITGEWDAGASQCIVTEAGGSIVAATFEPLTYNQRETLINPDFLVLGDSRVNWKNIVEYE